MYIYIYIYTHTLSLTHTYINIRTYKQTNKQTFGAWQQGWGAGGVAGGVAEYAGEAKLQQRPFPERRRAAPQVSVLVLWYESSMHFCTSKTSSCSSVHVLDNSVQFVASTQTILAESRP
jgi:hypothetical protein